VSDLDVLNDYLNGTTELIPDDVLDAMDLTQPIRAVEAVPMATVPLPLGRRTEPVCPLTTRQQSVLYSLSYGASQGEIAETLQVSLRTIKSDVGEAVKLLCPNGGMTQAVAICIRRGWI
jgi:DNA-binding NarL/FixJ family response regulator